MSQALVGESWLASGAKRRRELALVSALLVPAAGVTAVAAVAMQLERPCWPFLFQERVGQHGKPLHIIKMRTLTHNGPTDIGGGPGDQRATRIGAYMRLLGADELPQLLNVLDGSMALIGPRPLPQIVVDQMRDVLSPSEYDQWYHAYETPRPGLISEFGSISRRLDPQSSAFLLTRAELDVRYFEEASKALDNQILLGTTALVAQAFQSPNI